MTTNEQSCSLGVGEVCAELGFRVSSSVEGQATSPDWIDCQLCPERASDSLPFPLCAQCALAVYNHIAVGMKGDWALDITEAVRREKRAAEQARARSCVYYVRRRDRIKIGMTTRFGMRMTELLPDEVLAVEPGGRDVEITRQRRMVPRRPGVTRAHCSIGNPTRIPTCGARVLEPRPLCPRPGPERPAFVVPGGLAVAAAGPVTMCCSACGDRYDLPLQANLDRVERGAVALRVTIDAPDAVLLKMWAAAHRGPLATA